MSVLLHCPACGIETLHFEQNCLACVNKVIEEEKQEELNRRAKLSTEQRLALIESNILDLQNYELHSGLGGIR